MRRYQYVREPFDLWMVLDTRRSVPAEINGQPLVGLDRPKASTLAEWLNCLSAGSAALSN